MKEKLIRIGSKEATGYEISLGSVNLVMVTTGAGLVGCGALDVPALNKFNLAAARVSGVKTIDDLLAAKINLVNEAAAARGITVGMTGREALARL